MVEQTFTLANATGLHARPASLLVQTANKFPGTKVLVRQGDKEVDARSLLSILSLGAGVGATIAVRCDGPQEQEAMTAVTELVQRGFGE
jgi:phosphocarrier protein